MEINLNIEPVSSWGVNATKPLMISGPCSAETEEQVITTAKDLSALGIQIFRAGIWKPRTRPNQFEGVGSVGLKWMKTVKAETGMLTATEVANVKHVYEALKMGIDVLWIGART
jgi:chorismate mutase